MGRREWKRMQRRSKFEYQIVRRLIVYIVIAILLIGLAIIHGINTSWGFSFKDYERPLVFRK